MTYDEERGFKIGYARTFSDFIERISGRKLAHSLFLGRPRSGGVYIISHLDLVKKKSDILYIGASKNIERRLASSTHPMREFISVYDEENMYPLSIIECDDYFALERKLINILHPKLNKTHNGRVD